MIRAVLLACEQLRLGRKVYQHQLGASLKVHVEGGGVPGLTPAELGRHNNSHTFWGNFPGNSHIFMRDKEGHVQYRILDKHTFYGSETLGVSLSVPQ